jgi:hypothetical protein
MQPRERNRDMTDKPENSTAAAAGASLDRLVRQMEDSPSLEHAKSLAEELRTQGRRDFEIAVWLNCSEDTLKRHILPNQGTKL